MPGCPECRAVLPGEARFSPQCGMRVSASQRPAKTARRDQPSFGAKAQTPNAYGGTPDETRHCPARRAAKNRGGDATTTKGAARSKAWKGSCSRARLYRLIEE